MPDWKQCEGEVADRKFSLERYLGSSETAAVFLTQFASGRAAIKLKPAGQVQADELVERWNRNAALHHRHLAGILAAGTCTLNAMTLAYLVVEYAEENLAEVLRDRPLTTDEAREMLLPVADALAYLHGQGLVHGSLKPSNILAVGDTVKISCDEVSAGDPAADIRALGATLVQALTQQPATGGQEPTVDALPLPFREIAQNCLHDDPRLRWSADKIAARLRSLEQSASDVPASAAPIPKPMTRKLRPRHYVAAVALVVVAAAIVGGLVMHRTSAPEPSAREPVRPAPAPVPTSPAPSRPSAMPKAAPPVPSDLEAEPRHGTPPAQDGITRRVLPEIPAEARSTIHGTARVFIKVTVDSEGGVTEAALEPGGSPYFGRLAMEAARHWRFDPVNGASPRRWILRFEITRTDTRVVPRREAPE